jgi:hypothetical protein
MSENDARTRERCTTQREKISHSERGTTNLRLLECTRSKVPDQHITSQDCFAGQSVLDAQHDDRWRRRGQGIENTEEGAIEPSTALSLQCVALRSLSTWPWAKHLTQRS